MNKRLKKKIAKRDRIKNIIKECVKLTKKYHKKVNDPNYKPRRYEEINKETIKIISEHWYNSIWNVE